MELLWDIYASAMRFPGGCYSFDRELYAIVLKPGDKADIAICLKQLMQPPNEQGCFWLMGFEFLVPGNKR
jgi:hypothetical protein